MRRWLHNLCEELTRIAESGRRDEMSDRENQPGLTRVVFGKAFRVLIYFRPLYSK